MSMPNIPNITPQISLNRCDTINLLLSSIALEEIGLSHILNAEGEKLQHFLKLCPKHPNDYLEMNKSINKMLRTVVKSQLLLELKLEDVLELDDKEDCSKKHCKDCDKERKPGCRDDYKKPMAYTNCKYCGKEHCEEKCKKACQDCGKKDCKGCVKTPRYLN
ncbi:hypothetical protein [Jeotgalibacillus campisalis]|uniref:Uncharacterized protein n=1 Tax=Jeotgalibacillus campisalis TaxID=220754 RepID=A0A0C2R9U7_9BACL|nr:hypothetical protein [Jeotgalibacillus campisalis]KIL47070.1 hypothetical protein KR50_23920 [Jeotgalibacillus campisalis]